MTLWETWEVKAREGWKGAFCGRGTTRGQTSERRPPSASIGALAVRIFGVYAVGDKRELEGKVVHGRLTDDLHLAALHEEKRECTQFEHRQPLSEASTRTAAPGNVATFHLVLKTMEM